MFNILELSESFSICMSIQSDFYKFIIILHLNYNFKKFQIIEKIGTLHFVYKHVYLIKYK